MTNEFAWLEPIRKRARKLEEETKRIRAEQSYFRSYE